MIDDIKNGISVDVNAMQSIKVKVDRYCTM